MKNKIFGKAMCLMIMGMFVMSGIMILIPTENHSIPKEQKAHTLIYDAPTWTGSGVGNLASTSANWDNDWIPDTGECVVINSGSKNITWDIAKTFSAFYMNSSYSGIVTVTADFGTTSTFSVTSGTFYISHHAISIGGNFIVSATWSGWNEGTLIFNGVNPQLIDIGQIALNSLKIQNNVTIDAVMIRANGEYNQTIGTTVNVTSGSALRLFADSVNTGTKKGSIIGDGELFISTNSVAKIIDMSDVTMSIDVTIHHMAGTNTILTLGSDFTTTGTLDIYSIYSPTTATLNLDIFTLNASTITIGALGIINGDTGTLICQNWDSTLGTFNVNESTFIAGEHLFSNYDEPFYNLSVSNTILNTPRLTIDISTATMNGRSSYLGPANRMLKIQNGDYLSFIREGTSHVGAGDYAVMSLYRSTNEGTSWTFEKELQNQTGKDVRNYACGMTHTGRIFIFYVVLNPDTMTWNPIVEYMYSDNNGSTWSSNITMNIPVIDGVTITEGSPYGNMVIMNNNRIGFSYYGWGNYECQSRFAYSDDNGITWYHTLIGTTHPTSYLQSETDIIYLGNNNLIALSRVNTVGYDGEAMFTSINNGITWTERGLLPEQLNYAFPPTLTMIEDNLNNPMVLAISSYGYIYYSIAYPDDLMNFGIDAWSPIISLGYYGSYASIIWDNIANTAYMNLYTGANHVELLTITFTFDVTTDTQLFANNLTIIDDWSMAWATTIGGIQITNKLINNGNIIQTGKRINISGNSYTPIIGYGTFDGDIYLNGSVASSYQVQIGLPMGNLHTDRNTTINLDIIHSLQVIPSIMTFISISLISSTEWTAEISNPIASATFTLSGLESGINSYYDVYVDGNLLERILCTSGSITFSYSGPWSEHQFEVTKTKIVDNPNYSGLIILLIIIASISVGLLFFRYKEEYTITGLLYLLIGIFVAGILLTVAVVTFWK